MESERIEVQRTIRATRCHLRHLVHPHGTSPSTAPACSCLPAGNRWQLPGTASSSTWTVKPSTTTPMGLYDVTVTITPSSPIARSRGRFSARSAHRSATSTATGSKPADDGTLVTSYYDWSNIDPTWKDANIFPVISEGASEPRSGHPGADRHHGIS